MIAVIDGTLLALLAVTAAFIIRMRNLYAAAMLAGVFSLLSAGIFVTMDAVDVAFTEAAVGAGISTVLVLVTLGVVGGRSKVPEHRPLLPLLVVGVTGAALVYGTMDIPPFGDPSNPVHHHVADHYLEESGHEIGIPNVVTSVLASYRGYDTLGEVTVIFTAAVGVLLLLGARGPRPASGVAGRRLPSGPGGAGEGVGGGLGGAGVPESAGGDSEGPSSPSKRRGPTGRRWLGRASRRGRRRGRSPGRRLRPTLGKGGPSFRRRGES